ncbi:MAG: MarR family winged helix-turn-helix transcriptional regulator, partial [Paraclostridium sp.]
LGIGSGQVMFLLELYRGDGKNQEEIADALNIDKGTTARAIKKLEKEGFLIREKDKIDKRAYKIYLSEKGKSTKDTIYSIMDKLEEKRTANLNEEEKNTLIILLKKICTKM